jgi:myo-inositol-1(or 4)-monophosphatase
MTTDLAELGELAEALATEAGELVEEMRAPLAIDGLEANATTKSSPGDLVTAADRAAERAIIDGIVATRPTDAILGEEGGQRAGTSGVRWLVDPIDGTTNYVYDIASYSVSIAAEVDGVLSVGVVYNPKTDTMFSGLIGSGARRNGVTISCSTASDLGTALVATGFGYVAERRRGQAEVLAHLLPEIRDIRRFGSAALDLCAIACGQVDAYYERGLNPWDLAAGTVIAREAGATVGDLRGGQPSPEFVLAANPALFLELRERLTDLAADQRP